MVPDLFHCHACVGKVLEVQHGRFCEENEECPTSQTALHYLRKPLVLPRYCADVLRDAEVFSLLRKTRIAEMAAHAHLLFEDEHYGEQREAHRGCAIVNSGRKRA